MCEVLTEHHKVLTEHHIKTKVLTEHHPFKQRRCTKLKQPSPSRLEARAARDSSDSYAALPSSYAIVRMCALRFRRIKSLSWSLGRRLPRRCCRRRRFRLEPVRVVHGDFLLRRSSGPAGPSSIVLQHERCFVR